MRKENRQRTENEDGGVRCLTKIRIGDKKENLKRDNKRMERRGPTCRSIEVDTKGGEKTQEKKKKKKSKNHMRDRWSSQTRKERKEEKKQTVPS